MHSSARDIDGGARVVDLDQAAERDFVGGAGSSGPGAQRGGPPQAVGRRAGDAGEAQGLDI